MTYHRCRECSDVVNAHAISTTHDHPICDRCAVDLPLPDWREQLRRAARIVATHPAPRAVQERARVWWTAALTGLADDRWIELQAAWLDGAAAACAQPGIWRAEHRVAIDALATAARLCAVEADRAA